MATILTMDHFAFCLGYKTGWTCHQAKGHLPEMLLIARGKANPKLPLGVQQPRGSQGSPRSPHSTHPAAGTPCVPHAKAEK